MSDEALFGLGSGLSSFAESFNAARGRKQARDDQKRANLSHLIIEGIKSPDFQGDKVEAFRHLGEVMGAKGKHLDQMLSTVGQMFGEGPEIPQGERLIDPSKSLGEQTRPRVVGSDQPQTYGPTHQGAFRNPQQQQEWETNKIQQEAGARAAGTWEAQAPYRMQELQEKTAATQAAIDQRFQNHKAIIDYNIKNKIPAQAQAQASKEIMGLASAFEAKGVPKDEALRQAGEEVVGRYQATTGVREARAENLDTQTGLLKPKFAETQRHNVANENLGGARVATGQANTGIAQQRATTGQQRADQDAQKSQAKPPSAAAIKAMNEATSYIDKAKDESEIQMAMVGMPGTDKVAKRKAAEMKLWQKANEKVQEVMDNYPDELEGKVDKSANGWPYIKVKSKAASGDRPGVAMQPGFGPVPGTQTQQAQTSQPKAFPASKLMLYAKKHTNGNVNAARKEITSGGYVIQEDQ